MLEGKNEFYKKAEKSLISKGYQYFDGDRDIHGKGRQHANRPDYIAVKDGAIVIGEIKSPAEGPKSGSWRQIQKTDSDEFKAVRLDVLSREKAGQVSPEVGGHEIIIRGQIPDYYRKIGITYDLPVKTFPKNTFLLGYTFPDFEENNVELALRNCGNNIHDKINDGNGSVTYIFNPHEAIPSFSSDCAPLNAYYCILKNYKGFFKKRFIDNTHLYIVPIPEDKYLYLGLLGEVEDKKDCYALRLIVEIENKLLEPLINGEREEFKDRFSVLEKIPCCVNQISDGYHIIMDKKGSYLSSDIRISPYEDGSNSSKRLFLLKGELNFQVSTKAI